MAKKKQRSSGSNIRRDPDEPIKRFLRQEVNYACPVPGCGKAFLEWHHFDPPWNERHHQAPAGMIALCTFCHPMADRGKWTKEELRSFKQNPAPLGLIRSEFGWSERSIVYRLGGCYAVDCAAGVIAINNRRVLGHEISKEGRLLFSLEFLGENGQSLLRVSQNTMSVQADRVADLSLNTGGTYLKLWLGKNKPGIELQFRRITIDDLRDRLAKDAERSAPAAEEILRGFSMNEIQLPPLDFSHMHNRILMDYVIQNCLDSDGTVTLIDVTRARLHAANGGLVDVSDTGVRLPNGSRWTASHAVNVGGYAFNITIP